MKKLLLLVTAVILVFTACSDVTPQERQARATVKRVFKQAPEGDSYKPVAWGRVEVNSIYAGTGTEKFIGKKTGTPPSAYSITHRARMRNGFGMEMTFDIRVFFTNERCTEWAGMEYMDHDDPDRYRMRK